MASTAVANSKVSTTTVETAIAALLKYKAAKSSTEKLQLLPEDDYIYLNLTLKKIPPKSRTNPFKIPLSHPILDPTSQLCLIIDDRPQSPTPPSDQIKKLIKSENIPISKVIKISKLKTNYKPFEAKRKLCDSYDMFLVDKRVVHLLPKLIGKEFFKKKKLPLGVDLSKKNLKLQVERTLSSALLYFRTGTCCVMKVGKVAMEKDEIVENVVEAINGAVEKVPKKWDGVRSLHLKFYDSVALPVYQAMPDVKLKIEGLEERKRKAEVMKASDSEGDVKELSGAKDGKSGKKKKKGRIHEVLYMDVGDGIEIDDDDDVVDAYEVFKGDIDDEFVGQVSMEEDVEESDDDEGDVTETVGKKRNTESNGEKRVKKKAKSDKSGGRKSKKNELSGVEETGGKMPKRKSEVRKKLNEQVLDGEESGGKKSKKKSNQVAKQLNEQVPKVRDTKQKKRVSAK